MRQLFLLCLVVVATSTLASARKLPKKSMNQYNRKEKTNQFVPSLADDEDFDVGSGVSCDICKSIMTKVIKEAVNLTKAQIETLIGQLCDKLPCIEKPICHQILDPLLDKIADLILQHASADQICADVGLCDSFETLFRQLLEELMRPALPVKSQMVRNDVFIVRFDLL